MKKIFGWLAVNWIGVGVSYYGLKKVKQAIAEQEVKQPLEWKYKGYHIANNRTGRITGEKLGFVIYHPIYDGAFTVHTARGLLAAKRWIDANDVEEMGAKLA